MATSRQRMIDALTYNRPDRIPVVYHPSPAGLHVHGQKLLDLFNQYPPDNPIVFDHISHPRPETIDAQGNYHETRTDEWGTTWEWRIFGLHGHPKGFPLADLDKAGQYVFPAPPAIGCAGFLADRAQVELEKQRYFVIRGGVSIFEKLQALRPMDELMVDLITGDKRLIAVLDRLVDYMRQVIEYQLALGVDGVFFGDDWGGQTAPLISPKLFREIFKPRYRALMEPIQRAGRAVCFHSCGFLGKIFDDLLELGIDVFWPQILRYDEDELFRACKARRVSLYVHPDRQHLIPRGTPAEIDARIAAYADTFHALGGGGIFYVEIEDDAPFENARALIEAVHRYR